jgi:hypothetical protein
MPTCGGLLACAPQLDPIELWLITQIERLHYQYEVKDAAVRVLQDAFRIALAKRRLEGPKPRAGPPRGSISVSMTNITNTNMDAVRAETNRQARVMVWRYRTTAYRAKRATGISQMWHLQYTLRRLKKEKMRLAGAMTMDSVSNIRVLHGEVNQLQESLDEVKRRQATVESKLDMLVHALVPGAITSAAAPGAAPSGHASGKPSRRPSMCAGSSVANGSTYGSTDPTPKPSPRAQAVEREAGASFCPTSVHA